MALIQDDSVPIQIETTASSERIKELTMAKIHTKTHKRINKASRMLLIAAVAVMVLTVSAFAVVTLRFGLEDMQGTIPDTISVNGFTGMPEYEAAMEWANRQGNMTKESVAEKYGLRMRESVSEFRSIEALYEAAGVEGFLPEVGDNVANGDEYPLTGADKYPITGEYYDDDSFEFNCSALMPNGDSLLYSFYCFTKGTFVEDISLMGGPERYEEWAYTTSNGVELLIALGDNKSMLVADMDNCYAFIRIRSGTVNDSGDGSMGAPTVDRSTLEALAEEFDFAVINSLSE